MFISAAINKYVYTILHKPFENKIILHYSGLEELDKVKDIKNDIIRETFKLYGLDKPIEVTTCADIASGTGLGSSGSFGVGLVHALNPSDSKEFLAKQASIIQMDILKYPIGYQDQYVAAYGGINVYEVSKEGRVNVVSTNINHKILQEKLVMFFTGIKRDTNKVLKKGGIDGLEQIQMLAYDSKKELENQRFDAYGYLMSRHWEYKKKRGEITDRKINRYYNLGLKLGALGGKLIGAGGGGFLLFYTNDREKLIKNMPLRYQEFNWDFEGSKIIYNDKAIY